MRSHTLLLSIPAALALAGTLAAADAAKKVTYDEHVLPVFRQKCLACHNADKARGGLDLSTFGALMQGGASGQVVNSGDPDGSRLYRLAAHLEEPKMPPNAPRIEQASLDTIKAWIAGGALENSGSKPLPAKPKAEVALKSVTRGRPDGPPPMPAKPLPQDPAVVTPRPDAVTALAASPWAPLIAVGAPKQVLLYHADTFQLLGVLPFAPGKVNVLKFSRNGTLLLAGGGRGGQSGKAVLWNVVTGEQILEVGDETDAVLAADISADQTQIALGGPGKVVRIYSTKDGTLLREIKKHTDWVTAIEYSPDAVLLATGDRSGGVQVWEAFTGRPFYDLRGHTAAITGLSWRDDSNVLATGSEDTNIRLWEMQNGSNFKTWGAHGGGVRSVHFGHDGRLVSCGRDNVTKIWDGNGAQQRALPGTPDVALCTVFSHDGAKVFTGDWTGHLRAWSSADGKVLAQIATNPPALSDRIAAAEKEIAARQTAFDQANAAYQAAQANAQKAAAEMAAAQKAVTDTAAAAKAAADAAGAAKAANDQAAAKLAGVQLQVQARQVKAQAFAEAAAKVKAAADQAKNNPELAAAAAQAKQVADQAGGELEAAKKALGEADAQAKQAAANLAAAQKAAADTAAAAKAAADALPAKQAAVKPAADQAAAAKAALDQAKAALDQAKAALERLKAAGSLAAK